MADGYRGKTESRPPGSSPEHVTTTAGPHGMVSPPERPQINCPSGHDTPSRAVVQIAWRRTHEDGTRSWVLGDPMCHAHASGYTARHADEADQVAFLHL